MLNPSVEVKARDGVLRAEFWDCLRLDPNPVRELRDAYERHVRSGGKPAVVIDLSGVGFAGSTALSGFVTLKKQGARVVFYNVEPTVREVFRVSSLEPLFVFAADEAAALAAAADPAASGLARSPTGTPGASSQRPMPAAVPLRRPKRALPEDP